ncbi:hypothetical protein AcV7_002344 [Taiwanofungus camphoratus]|nr:hypothetical protein AcV7_002344 [Antrodia cinnamomea]
MEDDETLVDQSSPETNFPEVTQIIRASQQTSRTASATDRDDCTATPDAALTHDEKVDHKETSDTSEDEVNDKIEEHVTTSDTLSPRKNEEAGRSPMESGPEKEARIADKSDAEGSGEDEAELDQERPAVAAASPPKTRKRKLTNSRGMSLLYHLTLVSLDVVLTIPPSTAPFQTRPHPNHAKHHLLPSLTLVAQGPHQDAGRKQSLRPLPVRQNRPHISLYHPHRERLADLPNFRHKDCHHDHLPRDCNPLSHDHSRMNKPADQRNVLA